MTTPAATPVRPSAEALQCARDVAAATQVLRGVTAKIAELHPFEAEEIAREIQAICEDLSRGGTAARRSALRAMRDQLKMTQDEIGDHCGISRSRVQELSR